MKEEVAWASNLASLPIVSFESPPVTTLPELAFAHATPRVGKKVIDGKNLAWPLWEISDGSTSASPAQRHRAMRLDDLDSASSILNHLHVGLALPGTPSDYHFTIQHALDIPRRVEPSLNGTREVARLKAKRDRVAKEETQ